MRHYLRCDDDNVRQHIHCRDMSGFNWWYGEEGIGWEKAKQGAVGFTGKPAAFKWLLTWGETLNTHLYENFLINMKAEMERTDGCRNGNGGL